MLEVAYTMEPPYPPLSGGHLSIKDITLLYTGNQETSQLGTALWMTSRCQNS
jgi:hypothetical protein